MKKSVELRQKVSAIKKSIRSIVDGNETLTDELRAQIEQHKANIRNLEADIETAEMLEAEEQRTAEETADRRRSTATDTPEQKAAKRFSLVRAVHKLSEGKQLDGIEREMAEEGEKEAREAGVTTSGNLQVPSMLFARNLKRDMTAGTTTAGGHTIQTDIAGLIPILEPRLMTQSLGATMLRDLRGPVKFPRGNADAAAVWEGENDANAETSPTFDAITLSPNRVGAFTDISKSLLVQSSIDVENYIRQRLNFAIQKAVDAAAINGSGSGEPTGILNTSGIGDVAGGTNGATPDWSDIIDLETEVAVDNADLGNLAYLFTPGVRGYLKKTKLDAGSGMFIWRQDSREINGYRAEVSTQVPSTLTKGTASSICHAILFGNWAELLVAQWAGIDLVVDPYTSSKNALVTLVINSWWDIGVKHAASFAAMKDALTS